jgi:hypothetical protein
MQPPTENYQPKKRKKLWLVLKICAGLFGLLVVVTVVLVFTLSPSVPAWPPLKDEEGKTYYKYIVPVSAKDGTYLMAVAYEEGFVEFHEELRIYYVAFKTFGEPAKTVVYREHGGCDINQLRFYREGPEANVTIRVVLPITNEYNPFHTWTFVPPESFPYDKLESQFEAGSFRTYHYWYPGF